MTRSVEAGSGYASQSSLALHFGLGDAARVDEIEISWASGLVERYGAAALDRLDALDRTLVLAEGAVEAPAPSPNGQ